MTSNIFQLDTAAGSFRVAIDGPEDAPALVLSNSLGTTLEMWAPQVAALANSYRLIRYDTRGHGGSPITKGPYRFKQLAADVIAILDALHIEQAVFCGVSMGGHTALQLALDAPARLKGIVVCNSAAKIGTQDAWKARADALRQQGQAAIQELAESAPQRWFTPDFIQQQAQTVETMQAQFAALDAEGYAACCDALGQSDLRAELTKIQLPTLIVAGEFDPVTTVVDAEAMKAEIAGSTVVVLPASHISNVEAAEEFNQALSHFIDLIK
ncbi:3-oxoadipate enol-lactonase [Oligella urethralis]|uniref:3-oxoadipate enol-lactonase n=1 Tax=Oligella urethralis TaxID=90245 RepID=UPI00242E1F67|nr:3-oxoadipate enol-lactonase [Oligella urethralis]